MAAGLSHPGQQRPENEDAFGSFVENRLFIVADGMGGHNAGEVAAAMTIDGLLHPLQRVSVLQDHERVERHSNLAALGGEDFMVRESPRASKECE